jgi:hypothetical protein
MAQSVIGALRVNLGLDSAQFRNGLKQSKQSLASFASRAKFALAAAATAVAAGFVKMAKSGLKFIDDQAKMARTIDGTIDGLRALQLAAGDAGIGPAELGKSMQMLGARLVEAQVKGGATADALKRLGLNASELSKMDADARLATIADRIKELGLSAGETSQFLMDMGVRSKEMALLLMQGGDAIRDARGEIVDMGLSLSALDAAKVEEANDAMSRLSSVGELLSNRIAIGLAPALTKMADAMNSSAREGGALKLFIDRLSNSVGFAAGVLVDVQTIIDSLKQSMRSAADGPSPFGAISSTAGVAVSAILGVVTSITDAISGFAALIRVSGGFGEAMAALGPLASEVWARIGNGVGFIKSSMAAAANGMRAKFLAALASMAGKFVDFTWTIANGFNSLFGTNLSGASAVITQELQLARSAAEGAAAAARENANGLRDQFSAPLKSLQVLREKIAEGSAAAAESIDAVSTSATGLNDALGSAGGGGAAALGKVKDAAKETNDEMKSVKSSAQSAFVSFVTGAKSAKDALGQLIGKFAELFANNLFESLWSGLGGVNILGSLFGGSSSGLSLASGLSSTGFGATTGLADIGSASRALAFAPAGAQVQPSIQNNLIASGDVSPRLGIDLMIDPSGEFDHRVQRISGDVAAEAVNIYDAQSAVRTQRDLKNPRVRG